MLEGIRIVELEGIGPGPFAGMMLADMGADVIVVHRRRAGSGSRAPQNVILDRGKRSIELDLKCPADRDILLKMLRGSDALIEGFRPGVLERLKLGTDACLEVNPALVIGRVTGWGQAGPLAKCAGHDLNYLAMSGAASFSSQAGDPPFPPPTLVGDVGGGALYLVAGILAGLLNARMTSRGVVVDASMVDGSAHMLALAMSLQMTNPARPRETLLNGPHWSRTYLCSDGGYVSVQCLEPHFYSVFLNTAGLQDDPEFTEQFDRTLWPKQTARLAAVFLTRSRDDWAEVFLGTDACVAPILTPSESSRHPALADRSPWIEVEGQLQPRGAPRFSNEPDWRPRASPARGQHRAEILAELGDDP